MAAVQRRDIDRDVLADPSIIPGARLLPSLRNVLELARGAGLRVSLAGVPAHAWRIVAAMLDDTGGLRSHAQHQAR